jgi:DNA-binding MarR family transcriptional regulator
MTRRSSGEEQGSAPSEEIIPFLSEFVRVDAMKPGRELLREAEMITDLLRTIRIILKRPVREAIVGSGLTPPQVSVLKTVFKNEGLSLKDLSARLGLAHSTVSSIVDRLEHRGLVRRRTSAADRRCTCIDPTATVKTWVKTAAALHHPAMLVEALYRASPKERGVIREGLRELRDLLEAVGSGRRT